MWEEELSETSEPPVREPKGGYRDQRGRSRKRRPRRKGEREGLDHL